jgi:hypothetical protein
MGVARSSEIIRDVLDNWIFRTHAGEEKGLYQYYESVAKKRRSSSLNITVDDTDNWKYGFNTDGFNNFSNRDCIFKRLVDQSGRKRPDLLTCPIDLHDTIPEDIMERLEESRKLIPKFTAYRARTTREIGSQMNAFKRSTGDWGILGMSQRTELIADGFK